MEEMRLLITSLKPSLEKLKISKLSTTSKFHPYDPNDNGELPTLNLEFEGISFPALLDTGAKVSVLHSRIWEKLKETADNNQDKKGFGKLRNIAAKFLTPKYTVKNTSATLHGFAEG